MKVRYLGHACFEITSKEGIKVITDPYTKVGYELPEGLTADILTVSHGHFDHNFTQGIDARYLVNEAKAYSLEGVEVYAGWRCGDRYGDRRFDRWLCGLFCGKFGCYQGSDAVCP